MKGMSFPPTKIQEIYCDASTEKTPDKVSFFYKSSIHHDPRHGRLHVDFTLQIKGMPVAYWGYWRSRVSFWLGANAAQPDSAAEFDCYKTGFRLALAEAAKFIQKKYGIASILNPPTDEELFEKYKALGRTNK
jgi:hypothetical protein